MPIQLKMKIGQNEVTITGADEKEVFQGASFWGQLLTECGNCKSKDIGLQHQMDQQQQHYYSLKCRGCNFDFKIGQRRDGFLFPGRKNQETGKIEAKWTPPYQRSDDDGYDAPAPRQQATQRQQPRPAPRPAPRQQQSSGFDDDVDQIPY